MTPLEQVRQFHRTFGQVVDQPWTVALGAFRAQLIAEEYTEVDSAIQSGDRLAIAQELGDLAYVTLGTAVTFGLYLNIQTRPRYITTDLESLHLECTVLDAALAVGKLSNIEDALTRTLREIHGVALTYDIDLATAITAVHLANMSKLGLDGKPILRADGKALKGPNYRLPDLTPALLKVGKYT